jgi:hypothetical protein
MGARVTSFLESQLGIRDTKLSETLQLDCDLSLQKATEKITQAERVKNENRELREQNKRVDQVSRKNYSNQPRKWENKKMDSDQRQHNEKKPMNVQDVVRSPGMIEKNVQRNS